MGSENMLADDSSAAANAHLIAAAPDLLEALQALMTWAERTGGWESAVWDDAARIVANATGEQQ